MLDAYIVKTLSLLCRSESVDPLVFIVSRDEVEAGDTSVALGNLRQLVESRETARAFVERVDILMAGRRFGPDVDRELWTMILPAGGDRLEHELWCAVVRAVATAVLTEQGLLPPLVMQDEDMDLADPDALAAEWLNECLPFDADIACVLGELDYFRNIDLTWDETLSFSGEACGFPTSYVVCALKDWLEGVPAAQDAVTEESVEMIFVEWRTRFLRRVVREAEVLKNERG